MSKANITAKDIMKRQVFSINHDLGLHEVVDLLLERKISNAPVVIDKPEGRALLGFISEADCLRALANELYFSGKEPSVISIMKTHPYCARTEEELFSLVDIFALKSFRHLPVVDEKGYLEGIVSRRDVLATLASLARDKDEEFAQRFVSRDPESFIERRIIFMSP